MKYLEISRDSLISDIPYTIYYLERIDAETRKVGLEIHIRNTDHTYTPVRLEYSNYNNYSIWDKQIREYLQCHCCKCGKNDEIKSHYNNCEDYECILCGLCEECAIKEHQGRYAFVVYQIQKQSKEKSYRANHIKVRLKTADGKTIYRFADEIHIVNNAFVITNKFNSFDTETVQITGVDLGIRDVNDERIFAGDVLLAETYDGRIGYGMIEEVEDKHAWLREPIPQYKNFFLTHGGNDFPSPLNWMEKFKVIGNIGDIANFDGKEPNDRHYWQWCEENKELLDRVNNNRTLNIEEF